MSLLFSPPSFAFCSHNIPAATTTNTLFATGVTAGANNADGTAVTLLSALTHDVEYIALGFSGFNITTGANPSALLDLLVDRAGGTSWSSLIDDLLVGGTRTMNLQSATAGNGSPLWYFFPVWIPAGSTVGAMARTAHSATMTGRVVIYAMGGNRNPASWWCGQKVTSIGINAAASRGTDHTAGASAVYSSWASLGSALTEDASAYQWAAQGENDATWSSTPPPYYFEFGYSSSRVGPPLIKGINGDQSGVTFPSGPLFHRFAAGTQLQVRAASSGSSPQPIDVAAYLVS